MSCVWNANGTITCDRACDKSNMVCHNVVEYFAQNKSQSKAKAVYSINIFVTNLDKSAIYYTKSLPHISFDSAYIIDKINLPSLDTRNASVLLTIQDMTDYMGPTKPPPYLQLIIENNLGNQNSIYFDSQVGMNILMRTATIPLASASPTLIIMDRLRMT